MTRPSRNIDRRLLEAGRELYPATGMAGLSVRKVAERAGVNLGMFHYHFRTKDAFVRQVLQGAYEEMFANLELAASAKAPRAGLRAALNVLGRFGRDHSRLLRRLVSEALAGEPLALEFLRNNMPRHIAVILALIAAGQRQRALRRMAPHQALAFLAGSVAAPIVVVGAIAERAIVPGVTSDLAALVASDDAIAERVDCALAGIAAKPRRSRG
ncbi:MAG TPA: TetR/AcrR family transcriptional regulator [Casimicrobiaceae bacterium]|nr:TetR/AcrR family transcriptional regulator [Casimicrobiaceae bacterium]